MRDAARLVFGIAASAVLLLLALPPANIGSLGWFCLTPLLWAVMGRGLLFGFVGGVGTPLLAALIAKSGVLYGVKWEEGPPQWIFLGFTLYGIVIGYTSVLVAESKSGLAVISIAGRAVLIEAALTLVLPAHLALTQWLNPAALFLSSITGIWGVSFLAWWTNLIFAEAIAKRKLPISALVPAAILALCWFVRPGAAMPMQTIRVGLVQSEAADEVQLLKLHAEAGRNVDVVVWPELAGSIFAPGGDLRQLEEVARKSGTAFTTSFEEPGKPLSANVARLFSPNSTSAPYVKRKPFAGERSVHRAGTDPVAVNLRLRNGSDISTGLNICFDTCFPWIMRETRQQMKGSGVVLVPTQDPPTVHGVVQSIHAAYTTFRAAELATPIVRVDNTAYSMVVDDRGEILSFLPPGEFATTVDLPLRPERTTLYQRIGEWFLWADFLSLCGWFGWKKVLRSRQRN